MPDAIQLAHTPQSNDCSRASYTWNFASLIDDPVPEAAFLKHAPASAEDFHRRVPSRTTLDTVFQLEETRVLSNDWVIRYDTRYLQVARQSHQAPARSTVLVREAVTGQGP